MVVRHMKPGCTKNGKPDQYETLMTIQEFKMTPIYFTTNQGHF